MELLLAVVTPRTIRVSGRLGMPGGKSPQYAKNPFLSPTHRGRGILHLYLYITWQYALLYYRARGVTWQGLFIIHDIIHGLIYVPSTPC